MTRLRPAVLLSLLVTLAFVVAACGGGDGSDDKASSSTDVNDLLTQTFSGSKQVKSGILDLKLKLEAKGGNSQLDGPVSIRLSGPFESQGGGELPKFHLEASFEGAGQSINAGATSTGDKGFLSFQGTDYAVDDKVFQQFQAGFKQAQKQGAGKQQSFASLGMDPRKWLTDPQNEGDAKVGDDDTIKITGGVDIATLLDDVNTALEKASSLGLGSSGQVPEKLTEAQKRKVVAAVKDPRVEIYTGKDDKIMRRMVVDLGVDDKASKTTGNVSFDVSIVDLNKSQDISAPENAKPFSDLLGQLGGLGLGGGAAAPSASGQSSEDLDKFSKCLNEAGNDTEKARKCAELLSG